MTNKRCGAKTRSGEPCKSWAMPNGRCRMHGGKNKKGIAAGRFKDGRYSKYMPERLLERYGNALSDPAMLEQRNEIALMEARIIELVESIDSGGSTYFVRELYKAWRAFRKFAQTGKQEEAQEMIYSLDEMITAANAQTGIWFDIQNALEMRRKLVESERKRIIEAQEYVMIQDAMALAQALVSSINKHVKDDRTKQLIQSDLIAIYNRQ